jgi:hypothetical protein
MAVVLSCMRGVLSRERRTSSTVLSQFPEAEANKPRKAVSVLGESTNVSRASDHQTAKTPAVAAAPSDNGPVAKVGTAEHEHVKESDDTASR